MKLTAAALTSFEQRVMLNREAAQSGSQTLMLTVASGQGRRSAASLDPDCFIGATAARIRGEWMPVLRT